MNAPASPRHASDPADGDEPVWSPDGLPPERVFASPSPHGPTASGVKVSPDGRLVTYLKPSPDNQHRLDLWSVPTAGGEPMLLVSGEAVEPRGAILSDEEMARRERNRTAALSGVIDYQWDQQGEQLLIPAGGALFVADATYGSLRAIDVPPNMLDARLSPSGRFASYVRDHNLYVVSLEEGVERALTADGEGPVSYGVAEFVAQEEMDRYTGYWWAPDDHAIAYTRVDEDPVELIDRLEVANGGFRVVSERYPRAGKSNAVVTLYIRSLVPGAEPFQADLGGDAETYIARVHWSADGRDLYVQRQSRDQQVLDILRVDPETGASSLAVHDQQTPWINLGDHFYPLANGDFIYGSARSGTTQLYLHRRDGALARQITLGDYPCAAAGQHGAAGAPGLVGVDEAKEIVYFMASADTPIERQLYAASYRDPGPAKAITTGQGWWSVSMPKSAQVFIGHYSDPATPPNTALYDVSGRLLRWIEQNRLDETHPFAPYAGRYPAPEFGVLNAEDGSHLHYVLAKPVGFDPARRYPAIVRVYGGPGIQNVTRCWRDMVEKLYLEAGYVVFCLDNRGSANRSMAFEGQISRALGSVEVDDQVTGIDWLRRQPFVDGDKIGVTGWSYGGYMTLRMMTDPRSRLVAGAAGAPPTDYREYDTHYTERYMGLPQSERAAYDASAILPRLDRLNGRLLLLHGMGDDNVLFSNALRVISALQARAVPFDLMLYPGERHGIRDPAHQLHLWRTFLQFFSRELGGASPPLPDAPSIRAEDL